MTCTRLLGSTALAMALLAAAPASAETFTVTSAANDGDGSLRAALAEAAAADGADVIHILTDADISLTEALVYEGTGPLAIVGQGQTIRASGDFEMLMTTATTALSIDGLTFEGAGGYSINAQGAAGAAGILMDVPEDATGEVTLRLRDVTLTGSAGHGIHVSDCTLAEDCGAGEGGAGGGSEAGITVELTNVRVFESAYGRFDADGIRVDERGPGSITFRAMGLTVEGVGADGVELDEGQDGDVVVDVTGSAFIDNGAYCDPDLLAGFMPAEDEDDFDEGEMAADAIPGPVTGSPDDGCFEREVSLYEDGSVEEYAFAIDVDDGFDIDEDGPGSIFTTFTSTDMNGNFDEGFDFDEAGTGGVEATFLYVLAADNTDDGIKISESGAGDVVGIVLATEAIGNGGVGVVYEEEDGGDLQLVVLRSATVGNDDGELGIEAVQDDDGEGFVSVIDTEVADGIEVEGAEIDPD
ncbi:hypothetical protein HKCCE4037_08965 [Rhodobacterales bacterium HKCCE4037]|nr:hypothetical protein [Rhodobacterales bacterium HKCCE4037]